MNCEYRSMLGLLVGHILGQTEPKQFVSVLNKIEWIPASLNKQADKGTQTQTLLLVRPVRCPSKQLLQIIVKYSS